MNITVSFKGLSKETVILELWKNATIIKKNTTINHPNLTSDKILEILENPDHHIDYICGRSLKLGNIHNSWPDLNNELYDRDNGEGMMEQVSKSLLVNSKSGSSNIPVQNHNSFKPKTGIENLGLNEEIVTKANEIYNDLFGDLLK